jgi:hypothetical protein
MIGLIDCRSKDHGNSWAGTQPEMLEFFDRPLLQHAVEQMVQRGVSHCVLITEDTSSVMLRWGTGERWGCTFSAIPPRTVISFLATLGDQPVMIGRGDCIPCIPEAFAQDEHPARTTLVFRKVGREDKVQHAFAGWAMSRPSVLLDRCFATQGAAGLLGLQEAASLAVSTCICCDTPKAFLDAQKTMLDEMQSGVIFHGVQLRTGVWAARNVTVHSTAKTIGKVYLGDNVRIGPNVTLQGPVVICRDSAIDANCTVSGSSIQPGTYLGRGMVLNGDVVIKPVIIKSQKGTAMKVTDPGKLARTDVTVWQFLRLLLASGSRHAV